MTKLITQRDYPTKQNGWVRIHEGNDDRIIVEIYQEGVDSANIIFVGTGKRDTHHCNMTRSHEKRTPYKKAYPWRVVAKI